MENRTDAVSALTEYLGGILRHTDLYFSAAAGSPPGQGTEFPSCPHKEAGPELILGPLHGHDHRPKMVPNA